MDPAIQLFAAAGGMTVSLVAAFGGLAAWFVRRLDRRFDAIDRRFETIDRRFEAIDRRFDAVHEDIREQMAVAREERGRLSNRLDALGQRVDGLANQLSDVRHSVGRLEGVMLRAFDTEALAAPQQR